MAYEEVTTSGKLQHQLFPFQKKAVAALGKWRRAEESPGILSLPTGAGKTKTAVWFLLKDVIAKGGRVLWIAHRDELIEQAAAAFTTHAPLLTGRRHLSISRFQAGRRKDVRGDVVIGSVQSMANAYEKWFSDDDTLPNVVCIDECHHAPAKTYRELMAHFSKQGCQILGLSATPTRTKAKERPLLRKLFPRWVIYRERYLPLVRQRILAEPKHVIIQPGDEDIPVELSTKSLRHIERFRELPKEVIESLAVDEARNRAIVRHFEENHANYQHVLVFACNQPHAKKLVQMFGKGRAACLLADTPKDTRKAVLKQFGEGLFPVLCNVLLFSEGTDSPLIDTVFMTRPTMSETLYSQMVGRGSRGPEVGGKESFWVVDFVDNFGRFKNALAANYVLQAEFPTVENLGRPCRRRDQTQTLPAPVEALSQIEALMTELEVSFEDVANFVERHLAGWYEIQDERGFVRSLVVYHDDAAAIERAWRSLRTQIEHRDINRAAEPIAHAYDRFLDEANVDIGEWESLAELAVTRGELPVLHELCPEEAEPPSLEDVVAELRGQSLPIFAVRSEELYYLHFQKEYPTRQDFMKRLDDIWNSDS